MTRSLLNKIKTLYPTLIEIYDPMHFLPWTCQWVIDLIASPVRLHQCIRLHQVQCMIDPIGNSIWADLWVIVESIWVLKHSQHRSTTTTVTINIPPPPPPSSLSPFHSHHRRHCYRHHHYRYYCHRYHSHPTPFTTTLIL